MSELIKNVPELRFSGFDDFWKTILFGDTYSFSASNSLSRASLNDASGEYKNIHYGDIHTKYSTMLDAKNVSIPFVTDVNELSSSHAKSRCEVGDLVFADASEDYADVGKAIQILSLPAEPLVSGLHTFLAKDKHHQTALGFSGYLMSSYKVRKQIMTMAVGAKVLGISKTNLAKVLLDIPTKEEQQKIADFLSSADKKTEQLTEKHRLLTEYKKGVMQQIFTQQIRFKDDNGNDYPEWEEKEVGEVFKVTRGNVLSMNLVSELVTENAQYPVYSSQTKNNGLSGFYSEFLFESCITWTTDGANAGDVKYREGKFYCTNVCGVLVSSEGYANTCISEMINRVSRKYVSYVGNPKLMNGVMAKIKISFPSVGEQQKIANFLTEIDQKIDQAWSTLEQTKAFKKGLLQKMFV